MAPVVVLKVVLAAEVVGVVSELPTQVAVAQRSIVDWHLGIVEAPEDIEDIEDTEDTVEGIVLGKLGIHIQIGRDIH